MTEFESNIRAIYDHWNASNVEGVIDAFKAMGPQGFTVEYVGETPLDGVTAVKDMWNDYGGVCKTEIIHLLVNGNEAAALIHNIIPQEGGPPTILPSIETYRIEAGNLVVRYYHQTPEGTYTSA